MQVLACQKIISGVRVHLPDELCKELDADIGEFVMFVKDEDGKILLQKARPTA